MQSLLPIRLKRLDNDRDLACDCIIRRRRGVRRLILRVSNSGQLSVTAPARCARSEIERFVQAQSRWIFARLAEVAERDPLEHSLLHYMQRFPYLYWEDFLCRVTLRNGHPARVMCSSEGQPFEIKLDFNAPEVSLKTALQQFAKSYLPTRVDAICRSLSPSIKMGRVSVRDQKSRWGSCSFRRTISLNWRLVLLESDLRDYVIYHELAHCIEMNHSDAFWTLLVDWMPRARVLDKQLSAVGRKIMPLGRPAD